MTLFFCVASRDHLHQVKTIEEALLLQSELPGSQIFLLDEDGVIHWELNR